MSFSVPANHSFNPVAAHTPLFADAMASVARGSSVVCSPGSIAYEAALKPLATSATTAPSLWSRFTSLVGRAPAGQQFLVWGGLAGLGLHLFAGSEKSTFGNIFNVGLSIAGLATLIPGMQALILPLAAIYAARGLWTMVTGDGFLGKSMGLLDLACAIPGFSLYKNWANISNAATRLTGAAGNATHAYARTIARESFGPCAGRQVSSTIKFFKDLLKNPREAFGGLLESAGRGLSYYWGRFSGGVRSATAVAPTQSLAPGMLDFVV